MLLLGGVMRLMTPPAPLQFGCCGAGPHRPTSRCSMSKACVTEPERTNTAEVIADGLV
jgi:hypothetical protein